nr:hypothetical protein [Streptomyces sp. WAC04770]
MDRGAGDAEAPLQLSRGGKPFTWAQLAVVDGGTQDVGGLDVRRPGVLSQGSFMSRG